jgi:group II intron reverse transcriptase/maturase
MDTVATALDRRAAKARREPQLTCTSLGHHIPLNRLRDPLSHLEKTRAAGVDGHTVAEVTATLDWIAQEALRQIHTQGDQPPPVRRVWLPQPGQAAPRPMGIPPVVARALQPRTAQVLEAIDEPDVLNGSLGGRPGRSAQHALATLHAIIAGKTVSDGLEADLRHVFGSLHHTWAMRCGQLRVGAPRRLTRMRRWLTAGVMRPEGTVEDVESGTPQGGSIRVLLSKVYLHDVWEVWMAQKSRKHLAGEAYWVRYLDDGVLCFHYRSDALRVRKRLAERLHPFGLERAPEKTRLIACGRFAQRDAATPGKPRPEPFSFLGFTHYCTRNRPGPCQVERSTERKRLPSATPTIQRRIRDRLHAPVPPQQQALKQYLCGHYNYYGIAGNIQSLLRLSRLTEKRWRKTVSRRRQDGDVHWDKFQTLKHSVPLARPKLSITSVDFQAYAKL